MTNQNVKQPCYHASTPENYPDDPDFSEACPETAGAVNPAGGLVDPLGENSETNGEDSEDQDEDYEELDLTSLFKVSIRSSVRGAENDVDAPKKRT